MTYPYFFETVDVVKSVEIQIPSELFDMCVGGSFVDPVVVSLNSLMIWFFIFGFCACACLSLIFSEC